MMDLHMKPIPTNKVSSKLNPNPMQAPPKQLRWS